MGTSEKQYAILFVDDEESILAAIRRGMFDEDYACLFASSGQQALDILSKQEVAVIVSDMRMPGMDGLHLLRLVKEQSPRTVRIVLSGYTQLQQILTTINTAGVFKFITKPWMMDEELKVVLAEALEYYKLQERREELEIALRKQNESYQNILRKLDVIMETASTQAASIGQIARDALDRLSGQLEENRLKPLALQMLGQLLICFSAHAVHDAADRTSTDVSILFRSALKRSPLVSAIDRAALRETHILRMNVPLMEALAALLPEFMPGTCHGGRVRMAFRTEEIKQLPYFAVALLFPYVAAASTTQESQEQEADATLADEEMEEAACLLADDPETRMTLMNLVIDPVMKTMQGRFQATCIAQGILCRFFLPMQPGLGAGSPQQTH